MSDRDLRRHSGACARNREPILAVLEQHFPPEISILEIASGTGEHAAFFAQHHRDWTWQPTDVSPEALESVSAWVAHQALPNLRPPLVLDVTAAEWPISTADAIFCSNMIHISPWRCTLALLEGAGRVLSAGGQLATYGPYKVDGTHTAPSNASFDSSLRWRDPSWGIRDIADITTFAEQHGLHLVHRHAMPANNFTLVFEKQPQSFGG